MAKEIVADAHRFDRDRAARVETKEVQSTERGRVLVLLADGLFEDIDFDVGGFFSQLTRRNPLASISVQRMKQSHGKTARPGEARRGRQIAHRADINRRVDF